MSVNYTQHLGLSLWAADDPVLRSEFNANNNKLDSYIRKLPQITVGKYIGTGTAGAESPNSLSFGFTPMLLIIVKDTGASIDLGTIMINGQQQNPGFGYVESSTHCLQLNLTWSEKAVSWYTTLGGNAGNQLNSSGETYWFCALGV